MINDRDLIEKVYTDLHDAAARTTDIDYTTLSVPALLELQSRREQMTRSEERRVGKECRL